MRQARHRWLRTAAPHLALIEPIIYLDHMPEPEPDSVPLPPTPHNPPSPDTPPEVIEPYEPGHDVPVREPGLSGAASIWCRLP